MKAKNVASIFFSQFSLVYKVIVFLLIITLILSILGLGIILPVLSGLRQDLGALNLSSSLTEYVKSLLSGRDSEVAFNNLLTNIKLIPDYIQKWDINVSISIAVLVLIIVIFSIFYYMAYFSLSDIINNFMSSNSKFGFTSNYIYNSKKSIMFALIYAPIGIMYFILLGILVLGGSYLLSKLNPYLGIMVGYFIFILGLSVRRALFVFWIPSMVVDGLSAKDALKKNFVMLKNKFLRMVGEYFMVCIVGVILAFLGTILTVGLGVIIAYSVIWIIMEIMDLVEFYTIREYKFYIDDQTVFNPKKKFKDAVLDDSYSL